MIQIMPVAQPPNKLTINRASQVLEPGAEGFNNFVDVPLAKLGALIKGGAFGLDALNPFGDPVQQGLQAVGKVGSAIQNKGEDLLEDAGLTPEVAEATMKILDVVVPAPPVGSILKRVKTGLQIADAVPTRQMNQVSSRTAQNPILKAKQQAADARFEAERGSTGWTSEPTVSRQELGDLYPKSIIPFSELPKAMQRKVASGYKAVQGMADRAVDYSVDKAYELAAIAPWNVKRSGYLYLPDSLKSQLDALREVTGQKSHRHHPYSKLADAKARNRIKALGNMQDLRLYDATMQELGMPSGGIWTPELKTLIPINTKYHSGHHKLLQELELEYKGNPGKKMDELFSKMDKVTDIIQYMVDLRMKTLPHNLRMKAHTKQLLDVNIQP